MSQARNVLLVTLERRGLNTSKQPDTSFRKAVSTVPVSKLWMPYGRATSLLKRAQSKGIDLSASLVPFPMGSIASKPRKIISIRASDGSEKGCSGSRPAVGTPPMRYQQIGGAARGNRYDIPKQNRLKVNEETDGAGSASTVIGRYVVSHQLASGEMNSLLLPFRPSIRGFIRNRLVNAKAGITSAVARS
ncbi:hypothetical protein QYF36_004683 [Acer negundo]|nr:hypothetical protein QYF36_004683 [Acer negundo]